MKRALGMDYAQFEQSPIAFDYEAHDGLARLLARRHRGHPDARRGGQHAAARAPQPHRPGAQLRRAGLWRAHLRQGRGRQHGRLLQGPPSERVHPRRRRAGLRRRHRRDLRQLRRRRREPGGAQQPGLHHLQEAFDSRHIGQPEIIEKSPHLRGVRRRGRADDGGAGAVQPHARAARRDRLLRRVALLELRRVRHRDARPRDRRTRCARSPARTPTPWSSRTRAAATPPAPRAA